MASRRLLMIWFSAILSLVFFVGFEVFKYVDGLHVLNDLFVINCLYAYIGFAICVLVIFLKKYNLFARKKEALWLIPIGVLLLTCFLYQASNFFGLLNMPVMLILLIIFAARVSDATSDPNDDWSVLSMPRYGLMFFANWAFSIPALDKVFKSAKEKNGNSNSRNMKLLIGLCISIPVVVVIFALLSEADAVFAKMFAGIFEMLGRISLFNEVLIFNIIFSLFIFAYSLGFMDNLFRYKDLPLPETKYTKVDNTISTGFLVPVNLLFAVFTVIQFAFLWTSGLMQLPDGMIFSQYAREGFFQLLFVTVINFGVILFYLLFSDISALSTSVKNLLRALCGFTGVLVVSSFYRMGMYIHAYGLTELRISVLVFLVAEVCWLVITLKRINDDKIKFNKWFTIIGVGAYTLASVLGLMV